MTTFLALWFTFFIALIVLVVGEELSNETGQEGWLAGGALSFVLILTAGGIL